MANCEKIVICGFSGAGKSALLGALSQKSPAGWSFEDLDQLIVNASSEKSIAELVDKIGWQKFREKEFDTLMNWMSFPGKSVLALGGGALTEDALSILEKEKKLKIIYLHADFETCWKRLQGSSELRPLVQKGKEHMKELYQKRSQIFKKIPQRLENKDGQGLEALVQKFWSLV